MASYVSQGPSDTPTRTRTTVEGPYQVVIDQAKEITSQAGNLMIKLRGAATQSVDGSIKFEDGQGPLVFENLVFTASAAWKIDQYLSALGKTPKEGETVDLEADDQIGVTVPCYLKEGKTQKGDPCMEIAYFITPDAGTDGQPF